MNEQLLKVVTLRTKSNLIFSCESNVDEKTNATALLVQLTYCQTAPFAAFNLCLALQFWVHIINFTMCQRDQANVLRAHNSLTVFWRTLEDKYIFRLLKAALIEPLGSSGTSWKYIWCVSDEHVRKQLPINTSSNRETLAYIWSSASGLLWILVQYSLSFWLCFGLHLLLRKHISVSLAAKVGTAKLTILHEFVTTKNPYHITHSHLIHWQYKILNSAALRKYWHLVHPRRANWFQYFCGNAMLCTNWTTDNVWQ